MHVHPPISTHERCADSQRWYARLSHITALRYTRCAHSALHRLGIHAWQPIRLALHDKRMMQTLTDITPAGSLTDEDVLESGITACTQLQTFRVTHAHPVTHACIQHPDFDPADVADQERDQLAHMLGRGTTQLSSTAIIECATQMITRALQHLEMSGVTELSMHGVMAWLEHHPHLQTLIVRLTSDGIHVSWELHPASSLTHIDINMIPPGRLDITAVMAWLCQIAIRESTGQQYTRPLHTLHLHTQQLSYAQLTSVVRTCPSLAVLSCAMSQHTVRLMQVTRFRC